MRTAGADFCPKLCNLSSAGNFLGLVVSMSSQPAEVHATGTDAAAATALQRFGLHGMQCLVTGGTKGIGAAIVEDLAGLGAKVLQLACCMPGCTSAACLILM